MFTKCHSCSNDSYGKFHCKICSIKYNKKQQQKCEERKNLGLCIICGNKNDVNSNECSSCRKKKYQKIKETDKKRRKDGKCFVRICKSPRVDNCKFCEEHRLLDLLKRKERSLKLIKENLCTSCGSEKYMDHFKNRNTRTKHCQTCYLKLLSVTYLGKASRWDELLGVLIKQNYLCPYTGDKLVLGESASIDHILPKSKYSERSKDINNLVWISRKTNRMKHNYTNEEFMKLIEQIYKYKKGMGKEEKYSPPSP